MLAAMTYEFQRNPRAVRQVAPRHSGWYWFGLIVAVLLTAAGLLVIGFFVLFMVTFSNYGTNK
jgi:heme/copper-type cytochrome/quinol oxidase subunit 2